MWFLGFCIEYSKNEEETTAGVIGYQSSATEIIIPRSINHESKEYIVTSISVGAFYYSYIRSVSFEPNSELRAIEKDAFSYSNLARIQIPSHVRQIYEHAFLCCKQLVRIEFEPNSELLTIGEDAFSCSSLASIPIPASVVELKDG